MAEPLHTHLTKHKPNTRVKFLGTSLRHLASQCPNYYCAVTRHTHMGPCTIVIAHSFWWEGGRRGEDLVLFTWNFSSSQLKFDPAAETPTTSHHLLSQLRRLQQHLLPVCFPLQLTPAAATTAPAPTAPATSVLAPTTPAATTRSSCCHNCTCHYSTCYQCLPLHLLLP
jgi:hypothetical protein